MQPLPPAPPLLELCNDASSILESNYCLKDLVPSNFICSLCDDVVVGAVTLDCGCDKSTVCAPCWETYINTNKEVSDRLGFIWVGNNKCGVCCNPVRSFVPCHALEWHYFKLSKPYRTLMLQRTASSDTTIPGWKRGAARFKIEIWKKLKKQMMLGLPDCCRRRRKYFQTINIEALGSRQENSACRNLPRFCFSLDKQLLLSWRPH